MNNYVNMKPSESSQTLRTTDSEKKRAHVITRCLISIFKIFRMCKKTRKNKIQHKKTLLFSVSAVQQFLLEMVYSKLYVHVAPDGTLYVPDSKRFSRRSKRQKGIERCSDAEKRKVALKLRLKAKVAARKKVQDFFDFSNFFFSRCNFF